MTEVDAYLISAFVVLSGFLYWRLTRRLRIEMARQKALEEQNPGRGFDAGSISPQIQCLRQNFVSAARSHRSFPFARKEKIAMARCALGRLGFFSKLRGRIPGSAGQNEFDADEHSSPIGR